MYTSIHLWRGSPWRVQTHSTFRSLLGRVNKISYPWHVSNFDAEAIQLLTRISVDEGLMCEAYLSTIIRENGFQIPAGRHESAFCKAFNSKSVSLIRVKYWLYIAKSDLYEFYHKVDHARGARFATGMSGFYNNIWEGQAGTLFPFEKLRDGAIVVDVGGGRGQNCLRLGAKYPHLRFVVQDHQSVIDDAEKEVELPPSIMDHTDRKKHDSPPYAGNLC